MTPLYLYALLGTAPPPGRWRGLRGEPLRFVRVAGLVLATGPMSQAPGPSRPNRGLSGRFGITGPL